MVGNSSRGTKDQELSFMITRPSMTANRTKTRIHSKILMHWFLLLIWFVLLLDYPKPALMFLFCLWKSLRYQFGDLFFIFGHLAIASHCSWYLGFHWLSGS